MLDKRCPFCMSYPDSYKDDKTSLYVKECKKCLQKGITIKVQGETLEIVSDLWNNREYDNYIYKNIKEIKNIYNEGFFKSNSKKEHEILDTLRLSNINEGHFVMPNLDVLVCKDNHINEILRYLNIETDKNILTDSSICLKFGIVKISMMSGELMVCIPNNIKKKQIDKILEIICNKKYFNLNSYYFYRLVNKNEEECCEYKTLNDLILKIESIK